jgi:uncharacterized protein (DUF2147 family)
MKRFVWLAGLMALSSPACARDYSFFFRGHDIHIEAARHCRSLSCISVLVGDRHHRRDRDEDEVATVRDSAPRAPAPVQPPPVPAPVQTLPAVRAPVAPPTVMVQPAPQPVQPPVQVQPAPPPVQVQPAPMPAPALASAPSPPAVIVQAPPAPLPPPPAKVEQPKPQPPARVEEAESDPDTPVGDWQTEGKTNLVRIETCGTALCGFVLDAASHNKGESVLINMKPKNDSKNDAEWTGHVYSRASGNSYYGTMTLKDSKTLRVEACALGSFFCSGNNWTRVEQKPASAEDLISSHEAAARVRS